MTKKKDPNEPIRFPIAHLLELKIMGTLGTQEEADEHIEQLRKEGRVIEQRVHEVRYVPGTTLEPVFYFKNMKKNTLNDAAIKMRYGIQQFIIKHTEPAPTKDTPKKDDKKKAKPYKQEYDNNPKGEPKKEEKKPETKTE